MSEDQVRFTAKSDSSSQNRQSHLVEQPRHHEARRNAVHVSLNLIEIGLHWYCAQGVCLDMVGSQYKV